MNKRFQKIKLFIIFLMLFCSSLFFISPIGKARPLDIVYECTPFVIIEYNESLINDFIFPYAEATTIPITINAKIEGPEVDIILEKIGQGTKMKARFIVDLSIAEVSEGVKAAINPPIIQFGVSKEFLSTQVNVSVTIDQYLPAFSSKNIKIRMESRRLGGEATLVKAGNFSTDIPFFVGYLPQLSFSYPKGNVKEISPDETVDFDIDIQNWGNGATQVSAEVIDIPDGWHAKIDKTITLESSLYGDETKRQISLKVKPPISFGYHEDRAIIEVKMTPYFYNNTDYTGEPHYLYFIVQSKGFSTPGFELLTVLIAFIFVFLPIWKKKKNTINKKNNQMGGKK